VKALSCLAGVDRVAGLLIVEAIAYPGRQPRDVPWGLRGGPGSSSPRAPLGALIYPRNSGPAHQSTVSPSPALQPVSTVVLEDELASGQPRWRRHGGVPWRRPSTRCSAATPVDIAERHLATCSAGTRSHDLNQGGPRPTACLTDFGFIHAGWRLDMPADAGPGAPAAACGEVLPLPPPAAAPDGARRIIDGGMVLIDDGAGHGRVIVRGRGRRRGGWRRGRHTAARPHSGMMLFPTARWAPAPSARTACPGLLRRRRRQPGRRSGGGA
jgi:hypothetical protein